VPEILHERARCTGRASARRDRGCLCAGFGAGPPGPGLSQEATAAAAANAAAAAAAAVMQNAGTQPTAEGMEQVIFKRPPSSAPECCVCIEALPLLRAVVQLT